MASYTKRLIELRRFKKNVHYPSIQKFIYIYIYIYITAGITTFLYESRNLNYIFRPLNNNNYYYYYYYYYYLLQLGCHPVAVVILHVNKT